MATTRINAVSATATTFAGDDFLPIDGNVNATRRLLLTSLFASPSAIGSVTPAAGAFTTGTFSSTLNVTGVATLGAGAILNTPASGTVTNLTGTASININGTVGGTTRNTVAATTGNFQAGGGAPIILTGNASAQIQLGGTGATEPSIRYDAAGVLGVVMADQSAYAKIRALDFQGTVGATTASTGAFTTLAATDDATITTSSASIKGFYTNNATHSAVLGVNNAGLIRVGSTTNTNVSLVHNGNVIGLVSSTGLAVTGQVSATASNSVYSGAALFLDGGNGNNNAVYTTGTGSPGMFFDHRGSSNTGTWTWRYGTGGASTAMSLTSTGLAVTGALSATGTVSGAGTGNTQRFNYTTPTTGTGYGYGEWTSTGADMLWGIESSSAGTIFAGSLAYSSVWGTNNTTAIHFSPNNAVAMTIVNGGTVGIGTTNPSQKLHIKGSSLSQAIALENTGSGGKRYDLISSSSGSGYGSGSFVIEDQAVGARLMIDSSGNVLIGTTSASAKIHVVSDGSQKLGSFINTAGTDTAVFGLYVGKYANDSTTSQRFIGFSINNDNNGNGQINANGASQAAFGSFSDARLKENIVTLDSQLPKILALRPVEFDYRDGSGHQIGFVAQEMQEIYPDAVAEADGYLTLTGFGKTEARIIKAVQELNANLVAQIESLSARLAALESK